MSLHKRELVRVSGFPELAPHEAIEQQRIIDVIRRHYERAGFAPLETPLIERRSVLAAKSSGEIKTQMYGITLLNPQKKQERAATEAEDGGSQQNGAEPDNEKDVGIRFDLTVPLARYAAWKHGELRFPFRRYAIGAVMRGERPKKNRYRQFIQADIDVIGNGKLHLLHDAEVVDVVSRIFDDLRVGPFTLRMNNRKVLEGILRSAGCDTDAKVNEARDAIDTLHKIGHDAVVARLGGIGIEEQPARSLLDLLWRKRTTDEVMAELASKNFDSGFSQGVAELEAVVKGVRQLGVPDSRFVADPSLARGLDYYTGTVYELFMESHPRISVAGGGRYDELAREFTNKSLPGVGISIGVTRLLYALLESRKQQFPVSTVAPVLIATGHDIDAHGELYFALARDLRDAGVGVEVYIEPRNVDDQIAFAQKRGFRIALESGEADRAAGDIVVHNLRKGGRVTVPREALIETVRKTL